MKWYTIITERGGGQKIHPNHKLSADAQKIIKGGFRYENYKEKGLYPH